MRLIFPVCLIYIPVTEILFREILMQKEKAEFTVSEGWIVAFMTPASPGNGMALQEENRGHNVSHRHSLF